MKSWKTTLAGILAIVAVGANVGHSVLSGAPIDWQNTITTILGLLAGFGLIAAKDHTTP